MKLLITIMLLVAMASFSCKQEKTSTASTPPEIAKVAPMAQAAIDFVAGLTEEQKLEAILPFEDEERSFWHFTPSPHRGLTWEKLNSDQRDALTKLLKTVLSKKGMEKTREVMAMEGVLRVLEDRAPDDRYRHPELYYFMLFGDPKNQYWGWRFEGHHLSLNYTSVSDQLSVTPAFAGANPAEVPSGPEKGKRILAKEEDLARELLAAFNQDQLEQVLIADKAPEEIVTGMERKAIVEKQEGLDYGSMDDNQQRLLKALIQNYLDDMETGVASEQLERINSGGWDNIYFAWAGETDKGPGKAHYYRVHGPTLLIEYDNIQNNANHIHTVWRDLTNDFGEDLLKHHHQTKH